MKTIDVIIPGTGVSPGDRIFLTPKNALDNGIVFVGAEVTADNIVQIRLSNVSSTTAINPAANNWYFFLIRPQ